MYEIVSDNIQDLMAENKKFKDLLARLMDHYEYGCDECKEHSGCDLTSEVKEILKKD